MPDADNNFGIKRGRRRSRRGLTWAAPKEPAMARGPMEDVGEVRGRRVDIRLLLSIGSVILAIIGLGVLLRGFK